MVNALVTVCSLMSPVARPNMSYVQDDYLCDCCQNCLMTDDADYCTRHHLRVIVHNARMGVAGDRGLGCLGVLPCSPENLVVLGYVLIQFVVTTYFCAMANRCQKKDEITELGNS